MSPESTTRPTTHGVARRSLLVAAAALPAVLAGCGSGSSNGKATLTFYWWGGAARAKITNAVLDLYTKKHPNVTFKRQWQGYSGYYDKLSTMAAGNTAPDIFQIDDDGLAQYATRHVTLGLDSYVGKRVKLDGFSPGLKQAGRIDGKLPALPAAENTAALCWDKTVAKQYGMPDLKEGMSWEDLVAWGTQVTAKSGGKVYGLQDMAAQYPALQMWLRQRGKDTYNGTKLGYTADDLTEWFQFWVNAKKATPTADITHVGNAGDISKSLISTKQGAVMYLWSNQLEEVSKSTDHELGLVPVAGPLTAAWARSSMYWSVYSGSKYQEQALDVINFLVNDPEAGKILGAERGLAPNLSVRAAVTPSLTKAMQTSVAYETALSSKFSATPPPPPKGHVQVRKLLTTAAESVQFGKATPAAAAKAFVPQATAALGGT
ncbi:ABC transporter substrate-binding protein [Fodinicola acaciae]|uniref:ABC transporter substrate-binding protein n=1 Tax=Fodinicola acaciae TaxID=2681555 RepID=UPI0013D04425|nr:extracellular solute-binding protein [Fodinicola acaciae]